MNEYVIEGGQRGFDRLQVLARAHEPMTTALLDRIGVPQGARCLDVGCGSGDVTFELARRAGPAGTATGLDMDEVKLGLAQELAVDRGVGNISFEVADLVRWRAVGTYDLVFCRFVLQHLRDPLALLRTMWAAVAPGGVLVVVDADFEGVFCHPPDDAFDFWAAAYPTVLRAHGGDPALGRKLFAYFGAAGIPDPFLTLVQRCDVVGEVKQLPALTVEMSGEAIVSEGIASRDEVDLAVARLGAYASDGGTVVGDPRIFQVWARRERSG